MQLLTISQRLLLLRIWLEEALHLIFNDLCQSLAFVARWLCTDFVDLESIFLLLASHLIALNENPDVCPIAAGETTRRIITKVILSIFKYNIQDAADSLQFCAGKAFIIEVAVHSICTVFQHEDTDAVLHVVASNTF